MLDKARRARFGLCRLWSSGAFSALALWRLWSPGACGALALVEPWRLWSPGACGALALVEPGRLWSPRAHGEGLPLSGARDRRLALEGGHGVEASQCGFCVGADGGSRAGVGAEDVWRVRHLLARQNRSVVLRRPAVREADRRRQSLHRQSEGKRALSRRQTVVSR